jgi:hypothetical protein
MSTTSRTSHRFLPTLTEVVSVPTPPFEPAAPAPDVEATVQSVMRQVSRVIDQQLQDESEVLFRQLVTEQMRLLGERLRAELEVVVRQAVIEALPSQSDFHKLNS